MFEGVVTDHGSPFDVLTLGGRVCPLVVDTGFNGCLELPEEFHDQIPKVAMGTERSELAAGHVVEEESLLIRLEFDGRKVAAQVTFAPVAEGLIGTNLLAEHRLEIDFPAAILRLTRTVGT